MSALVGSRLSPLMHGEKQSIVIRPMSDWFIFGAAVFVGLFICIVSAIANAYLIAAGIPFADVLIKCDAVGGMAAILLVWRLLRWSRERNQLVRERERIVAELNHEVRNALQALSIVEYQNAESSQQVVNDTIDRIQRALNEHVPNELLLPGNRPKQNI